jgi:hypothetical protein
MSQVLTAHSPDLPREVAISPDVAREAEQMLIEEARRRQRRRQRVIATILSTIVAAAGVAYAVASGATSTRPRPISGQPVSLTAFPICSANHLHVSLSGEPEGAAGTNYFTLKLLNNGPECTVAPVAARGFLTTSSNYVGPWSNVFITDQSKTVITTGHAAYVPLGVGVTENWPTSLCRAQSVNAVRIALAGNHSLIGAVAIHTTVCTVTRSLHTQSASLSPSGG